jgi:subtilisin family serine protease
MTVRASAVMPGLARANFSSPGRAQLAAGYGAVLDHNLVQIGAPVAWRAGDTGAGVKVAVLDSGVDAVFPDLRGQIAARRNFTSPNHRVVTDKVGQGTFVAGLIAGTGRAAGGERRGGVRCPPGDRQGNRQ